MTHEYTWNDPPTSPAMSATSWTLKQFWGHPVASFQDICLSLIVATISEIPSERYYISNSKCTVFYYEAPGNTKMVAFFFNLMWIPTRGYSPDHGEHRIRQPGMLWLLLDQTLCLHRFEFLWNGLLTSRWFVNTTSAFFRAQICFHCWMLAPRIHDRSNNYSLTNCLCHSTNFRRP